MRTDQRRSPLPHNNGGSIYSAVERLRDEVAELRAEGVELGKQVVALEVRAEDVATALAAAEKRDEKWREASNEVRAQILEERGLFATSDKVAALIAPLELRLKALEDRERVVVGRTSAFSSVWATALSVVSLIGTVVAIVLVLMKFAGGN